MKVILQQDLEGGGKKGDLINVADGYARNYLIPKKIAVKATPDAMKAYEKSVTDKQAKLEREKEAAKALAAKIQSAELTINAKKGSGGRLFGSVNNTEIVAALESQVGLKMDKHDVILAEPIKHEGSYTAKVKLGHGISAELRVVVE